MKRRDFLNGMLLTAASLGFSLSGLPRGLGAAPDPAHPSLDRTDDFRLCHEIWQGKQGGDRPGAEGPLHDCIIVGGGISGLVAAWKLRRLGITDVLLLEKDAEMGGLCRSDKVGNVTFARASAYASFPWGEMIDLYRDLGIVKKADGSGRIEVLGKYQLKPPYDQIFVNGTWVDDPFYGEGIAKLPVSQRIRDELKALGGALEDLFEWRDSSGCSAFDTPLEDSSKSPKMRGLDAMSLGEYAVSRGWSLEMISLFDPVLRSAYGTTHDRISAWAGLDFLIDEILPTEPGEGSLCFPGGNAFLAENLVRLLDAESLMSQVFVTWVREQTREVHVSIIQGGRERTLRARTVVFAAPQYVAPSVLPDLPAERRAIVAAIEYAPYLVANVAVAKTPPRLSYSNQLSGDFFMSDFIVADWAGQAAPQTASRDRPNVLSAYCPLLPANRGQLMTASMDDWQTRVLRDFEKCLPGVGKTVTGFYLYRWGHALGVPVKGWLFSAARKKIRQPLGRVFFACNDVEGIPTVDHAMAGGFRAAREVADSLG